MMKLKFRSPAHRGFTLIELMLIVGIVAVLAAFAYPAYTSFLKKGYRADMKATLMEAAHTVQRYGMTHNTYVGASLPAGTTVSPSTGTARYNISIANADATKFTLQAVPAGSMAGDECGTYTLSDTGKLTRSGAGAESICLK